ncbi:hypothetical protein SAMN05444157_3444 [Frankineae bacterium MT45]|nr:hypothetical protein SAMN05444157_3444 [Frankineae bacterium MT45]
MPAQSLQTSSANRGRSFLLVPLALALVAALLSLLSPASRANAATPQPTPVTNTPSVVPPTKPADRATFGIGPATNGKNDSRPFFSYTSGPGGVYTDSVAITNYSAKPLDLLIYSTDLVNGIDGTLSVAPQAFVPRNAGVWIQLPARQQTVHVPGTTASGPGRVVLPFTLHVPAGASPGDHSAGIVASLQTLGLNPKGQNVRLDQRVATRVYVRVKGAVRSLLTISDVKVSYKAASNPIGGGVAHVTYLLRNGGNVNVGVRQAVSVTGLFGTKAKADPIPNQDLLLPGVGVRMAVDVKGVLPTIFEHAHITASPMPVKGSLYGNPKTVTKSVSFHAIPWMAILILIGLLLLIVLTIVLIRRRRRRPPTRPAGGGPKSRNPRPSGPSDPTDADQPEDLDHSSTSPVPVGATPETSS